MPWEPLKQQAIQGARQEFQAYLGSIAFWRYVFRLRKKFAWTELEGWWWCIRMRRLLRYFGRHLARKGDILLGVVVMRNTLLANSHAAAPALVLGSFNFSATGMDELIDVAKRFDALRTSTDDSARDAVRAILADEEYKQFRRRPLPVSVGAPDHLLLFDELMRGEDFFELEYSGDSIPCPFVVLFANRNEPVLTSAVVPRKVAKPVVEYLLAERILSPCVSSPRTQDTTEQPPPLPQTLSDGH